MRAKSIGVLFWIAMITGVIGIGTIARADEELSGTTKEMSPNFAEAAKGSNEIVQNIAGVSQAAQEKSSSAHESMKAAD